MHSDYSSAIVLALLHCAQVNDKRQRVNCPNVYGGWNAKGASDKGTIIISKEVWYPITKQLCTLSRDSYSKEATLTTDRMK